MCNSLKGQMERSIGEPFPCWRMLYNLYRHIVQLHSSRCIYFCANKAIYVLHVLVIHECPYITCLMCNAVSIRMYRITFKMLCSYFFLSSRIVDLCCLHFRSCASGVSGVASFITTNEEFQ